MSLHETIKNLNDKIAMRATLIIGTMWCVYAFAIMVMIPLFIPATSTIIQYISSAFLQLTFLPLIMVGQDVMSRKSELRAQQDHETIMAEMTEIKAMHIELHLILSPKEEAAMAANIEAVVDPVEIKPTA